MTTHTTDREPTPYERAGMIWWNSLSEPERAAALEAAGRNASAADAYRVYLERKPQPQLPALSR